MICCTLQCLNFLSAQSRYLANFFSVVATPFHSLCSLDEALVGDGLFDNDLVLFPFFPVNLSEVVCDLLAEGREIVLNDRPYDIGVNLIVTMCKIMSHLGNL